MSATQSLLFAAMLALLLLPGAHASDTGASTPGTDTAIAPSPAVTSLEEELSGVVARIKAKLQAGTTSEAEFAPELAEFDALLERHAAEKTDEVAQVLLLKAMLYVQIFADYEQGVALLQRLTAEFPATRVAAEVPQMLAEIEQEQASARALAALVGQPAPALNFEWASREGLTTLADLKGKVVVLDFWATWCGPCIRSFPEVRELAAHYAGQPVEVIGVTSLQGEVHGLSSQPIDCAGDAAKEHGLMTQYIEKKNITWTIAFSREPVFNPAWGIRGIPHVAIVAPDGTVRHTGLHPSSPLAEKTGKIDALLAEFGLAKPAGG